MNDLMQLFGSLAPAPALIAVDLLSRVTLLLLLATVVDVCLRRRSAALRHRIWSLTLCGLLILPGLTLLLPSWGVPLLPAETAETVVSPVPPASPSAISDAAVDHSVNDRSTVIVDSDELNLREQPLPTATSNISAIPATPEDATVSAPAAATPVPTQATFASLWPALWLAGSVLLILPLLIGTVRNGMLRRSARDVSAAAFADWLQPLSSRLGLTRKVLLLETSRSIVPMTWGVWRPIVLFPQAWKTWPDGRRQLVLLHELAHVKRFDVAFQVVARLACAVYWFHPLAWYALRRLRIERELACDDCVLLTGARPSEYAQELLDIARRYQPVAGPTTVAMAQKSSLEQRVRSVLDHARSRLPLTRRSARYLLAVTLLLLTGVAVIQPSPADSSAAALVEDSNASDTVALSEADDVVLQYRGRVVDPDGNPVAGAKIYFTYHVQNALPDPQTQPRAVSETNGWFEFSATRANFEANAEDVFAVCTIVAVADGYGFGSGLSPAFETTGQAFQLMNDRQRTWLQKNLAGARPILQLVHDDSPVTGRLVDLEGQPISGVQVSVTNLWYNDEGSLDAWEAASKEEKADFYSLRNHTPNTVNGPQLPTIIPIVETNSDGRFTVRGIGRERVVRMTIRGPSVESIQIQSRTRDGNTIRVPHQWTNPGDEEQMETYLERTFTQPCAPSRPVVGRITDQDSGAPIGGVRISAGETGTFARGGRNWINAISDADGRYTLHGLPVSKRNKLYITPPVGTAWLPAGGSVAVSLTETQIDRDFELQAGILVTGQAVDDRTGEPVAGRVNYSAYTDNPHLESFPDFGRSSDLHEGRTDPTGRFQIAVLPGEGVLSFMALEHQNYRRGAGTETLRGDDSPRHPTTRLLNTVPSQLITSNADVLRQIAPSPDDRTLQVTLALTAGSDVSAQLVGADGAPLAGGIVSGTHTGNGWYPVLGNRFQVTGYYPDEPRDLFAWHAESELAGYIRLEGDPPQVLKISMQPSGSVQGRLLDESGAPMPGEILRGTGIPQDNAGNPENRISTNDKGEFLIPGLIPGRSYTIVTGTYRLCATDVTVTAGQILDLGDVRVTSEQMIPTSLKPVAEPAAQAATNQKTSEVLQPQSTPTETVTVSGQVLLPNGQPAVGATVRSLLSQWAMMKEIFPNIERFPEHRTTTDAKGQFSIEVTRKPYGDLSHLDQRWQDNWKHTQIAASLPGYGGSWIRYVKIDNPGNLILQLVEDLPVRGQVIDLEGNPVSGVEVHIGSASRNDDNDLTPWIQAANAGAMPWTIGKHLPHYADPKLIDVPNSFITDEQGQFEISGIGRERVFRAVLRHDRLAYTEFDIITRKSLPFDRAIGPSRDERQPVQGAEFTLTAAPSQAVTGIVRDAETGHPMAGVAVESYKRVGHPYSNDRVLKTVTDSEGRFRLLGMPKGDGNRIVARPNDEQPYFIRQVDVPNPPGLEAIPVEIKLNRGIWITGKLTDKFSGEPVQARVYYLPYRSNEFAQALPEFDDDGNTHADQMRYRSGPDGTYRLVGLPGPAVIGAQSVHKHFRRGVGYERLTGRRIDDRNQMDTYRSPSNPSPKWPDVMQEIDPAADATDVTVDLQLDPGLSVPIRTVGPDGQLLTNVTVWGIVSNSNRPQTMETATFDATNFGPDETRSMCFTKDNLGWATRVKFDEVSSEGLTVTLQPMATVRATLQRQDGSPLAGSPIQILMAPPENYSILFPHGSTDDQGQVELSLPAGTAWNLDARHLDRFSIASMVENQQVTAGQVTDLGRFVLTKRGRLKRHESAAPATQ